MTRLHKRSSRSYPGRPVHLAAKVSAVARSGKLVITRSTLMSEILLPLARTSFHEPGPMRRLSSCHVPVPSARGRLHARCNSLEESKATSSTAAR